LSKLKSAVWTKSSRKRIVVVPEEDFARIAELLEGRELSRVLKGAKRTDAAKPRIPFAAGRQHISSISP
jgi:hypothetical protein